MMPLQAEALSPGTMLSTCLDARQEVQWLRHVPFAGGTTALQASHVKPVFITMKFFRSCTGSIVL